MVMSNVWWNQQRRKSLYCPSYWNSSCYRCWLFVMNDLIKNCYKKKKKKKIGENWPFFCPSWAILVNVSTASIAGGEAVLLHPALILSFRAESVHKWTFIFRKMWCSNFFCISLATFLHCTQKWNVKLFWDVAKKVSNICPPLFLPEVARVRGESSSNFVVDGTFPPIFLILLLFPPAIFLLDLNHFSTVPLLQC